MNRIKSLLAKLIGKPIEQTETIYRGNVSYDQAKTIGILFSAKNLESIDALADFIKVFQQEGKQVKALTYYNTKDKDGLKLYNFNHHVITEKDVTKSGEVSSLLADDFVKTEFDYLFCIDIEPSSVFKNILQRSHAKCRIGKFTESQMSFELMIKMDESQGTDALIRQMYHYIKTIKND